MPSGICACCSAGSNTTQLSTMIYPWLYTTHSFCQRQRCLSLYGCSYSRCWGCSCPCSCSSCHCWRKGHPHPCCWVSSYSRWGRGCCCHLSCHCWGLLLLLLLLVSPLLGGGLPLLSWLLPLCVVVVVAIAAAANGCSPRCRSIAPSTLHEVEIQKWEIRK